MKVKLGLLLFLLLLMPAVSHAQTTVNGNVTDLAAQAWFGGTWSAHLQPAPGNPIPNQYYIQGTTTPVPNQTISGTLDGSGNFTVSLYPNAQIGPANSVWLFTFYSLASTLTSYSQSVTVSATSPMTLNITPPAATVNMANPPINARAYSDSELVGATLGQTYFNLTSTVVRVCATSPCGWTILGGSGGGVTGCTTTHGIGYENGTPDILTCDPSFTYVPTVGSGLTVDNPSTLNDTVTIQPFSATHKGVFINGAASQSATLLEVNNGASDGPFSLANIHGDGLLDSQGNDTLLELRIEDNNQTALLFSDKAAPTSYMYMSTDGLQGSLISMTNSASTIQIVHAPVGGAQFVDETNLNYWQLEDDGSLDTQPNLPNPLNRQNGVVEDADGTGVTITGCGGVVSQLGGLWVGSFRANSTTCNVTFTPGVTVLHGFFCKAEDLTTPADLLHQSAYTTTTCSIAGTVASNDLITFYLLGF